MIVVTVLQYWLNNRKTMEKSGYSRIGPTTTKVKYLSMKDMYLSLKIMYLCLGLQTVECD
jgi:hypothetical protein